jgi:hypothetical protein
MLYLIAVLLGLIVTGKLFAQLIKGFNDFAQLFVLLCGLLTAGLKWFGRTITKVRIWNIKRRLARA